MRSKGPVTAHSGALAFVATIRKMVRGPSSQPADIRVYISVRVAVWVCVGVLPPVAGRCAVLENEQL